MAEIPFEYLLAGIESARGTALNPPTRYLNMAGVVTPKKDRYRPDESRGTLAEYYRSTDVRRWCEWEAEGGLDVYLLPLFLNCIAQGGIDGSGSEPTTPASAILTRLWTFEPSMTADDLESLTLYWGDPNIQAFQAAYCMPTEMAISADASGSDGVTLRLSGQGHFPSKTAPSSVPSMLQAPLLLPGAMQLWIDSASAIGTTEILSRLISAEVTVPSGISFKWGAAGPTGNLNHQLVGRGKRHVELKLSFEVPDMVQYDLWAAATSLKTRIRFNGPAIETVAGPLTFYNFAEFDVYGPFDSLDWGENEGSNRTIEAVILSEYDSVAGYDWCARVQNNRATL